MIKHTLKKMFLTTGLCALGLLAACGGGGGSAGTSVFDDGASQPTGSVAADLIVQVSSTELLNSGSTPVTLTVTAVNANRQTVGGVPVTLAVSGDAIVAATDTATDTEGKLVGSISTGPNKANRVVTVTATSGAITRSLSLQVVGAKLAGTAVPTVVAPNNTGYVRFQLTDTLDGKMANQPIQVVATQLTPASIAGVTDGNGEFVFNYTATGANGAAQITATAGGTTNTQTIQIGTTAVVDAIGPILTASVQAVPSVVSVNQPGNTINRAELRALFVGNGNIPIPNVRVKFDLGTNPTGADGTFSSGAETIYSNSVGVATASYTPKATPSPTSGITVRACYALTDAGLVNCPTFVVTTLTVSASPMNITIGHDGTIGETAGQLMYQKRYVVSVADSAGQPMAGVQISKLIEMGEYGRGQYGYSTTAPVGWGKIGSVWCANEDDGDQRLEAGEDINNNNRLDPGVADVTITLVDPQTKADGTAVLTIQYPKNYATWAVARITVTASVGGTEGRHSITIAPLPALNTAFTNATADPPFRTSPYGTTLDCTSPF